MYTSLRRMVTTHASRFLFLFCLLVYFVGVTSVQQTSAQTATPKNLTKPAPAKPGPPPETVIESVVDPEQVPALVGPMTDSEVRELLISRLRLEAELRRDNSAQSEPGGAGALAALQKMSIDLAGKFNDISKAIKNTPDEWRIMVRNLTDDQGYGRIGVALVIFIFMVVIGLSAEFGVCRLFTDLRLHLEQSRPEGGWQKLRYLFFRLVLEAIAITIFALVAYAVSFVFFERFAPLRVFVSACLLVWVSVRAAMAVGRFLLAPKRENIRLFPLRDVSAKYYYWRFVSIAVVWALGFFALSLFTILGLSTELQSVMAVVFGTLVVFLLMLTVWQRRLDVAHTLQTSAAPLTKTEDHISTISNAFARSWHWFAIAFLFAAWGIWCINIVLDRGPQAQSAVNSMLILASLPLADYLVRVFLNWLFGFQNTFESSDAENRGYAIVFQNVVRILLIGVALYVLSNAFGIGVSELLQTGHGATIVASGFNILVTLLLAYIVWELAKGAINRHLPEPESIDTLVAMDGEGGEAVPATRIETLLPLLRSFICIVLVVIVTMIVLSSLGVNIGPLLAGAGVVGLAIGFGAQKLVQDVISGVFFLIDDAFRVGEYIEAAGMTGTVESISMRSMRLRHHLGPVQTIPYSEVANVKNHSRDYVIMKLPFRLPYDTDIEKVRKTIKKVGQKLMEHPEYGENFIAPLKSQGVLEMDDSAMVMRMKFTAKPGEQWVLRREAYRQVKEALLEQGIHFAHRQVTVHVPNVNDPAVAGAAAGAALAEEEKEKQKPSNKDIR